jgi:hypothetical protein
MSLFWFVMAVGIAIELVNIWLVFRTRNSGFPVIPPVLITIGSLQSDWPLLVKWVVVPLACIVHFVFMYCPRRYWKVRYPVDDRRSESEDRL